MRRFGLSAMMLLVFATTAASASVRIVGMTPSGMPTLIDGAAYGVTLGGGKYCRTPLNPGSLETGCGTMYRFDPSGRFDVIHTFDAGIHQPSGALASTPDGAWLYGGAKSSPGTSIIYRISRDGSRFEIVARLDAASLSSPTLVSDKIYVVGTSGTMLTAVLYEIAADGKVETLAQIPYRYASVAPIAGPDGSIYAILNDFACGVDIVAVKAHAVRTLFHGEVDKGSDLRCYRSGEPASGLAMFDGALVSSNPREIIRIGTAGSRSILTRLPSSVGDFVGGIVVSGRTIFALAASPSLSDSACLRLLRISESGEVAVVRAFPRSEERCMSDEDRLGGRIAIEGDEFVVLTNPSEDCDTRAALDSAACGSIVRFRADGPIDASHDFVQTAPFPDGGSPVVRVYPAAEGRIFQMNFVREGSLSTQPFALDPSGVTIELRDSRQRRRVVNTSNTASLVSHRASDGGFISVGFDGKDLATLNFPLPSDLPEGMYSIRLGRSPRVNDGAGQALEIQENAIPTYIPAATLSEVIALRKRYVGKVAFGIGRGFSGVCSAPPFRAYGFPPNTRGTVVEVTRETGQARVLQTSLSAEFLSVEPLEYKIETPRTQPSGVTAARTSQTAPGSLTSPVKDCSTLSGEVAGTWQFERTLSLSNPIDPRWPPRFRLSAAKGIVLVGMTRAMVTAALGYPQDFGTVAKLQQLKRWSYDMYDWVTFENNRVASVHTGGPP